ncbi:hypothetical protein OG372_23450 [Streptomyces sp. NBC_01020]|uniref:hypothetical protein n=1 Tax=unclassified Streptomyces TaxID=2593676 RepID=UPI00225BA2AC|nr:MULTISPECIES: hypothetical protein [unclassified Streptomyces]MCX4724179.1 hypothetical protein [Streptomyces sp. NBC_01306]WSV06278.1 hypothetical protein OG372_23450 [Streptomyces sp. NBC_01020]WSX67588.1 hypothetical protein OG221_13695 [Streptomyces sp. NBC_00932]
MSPSMLIVGLDPALVDDAPSSRAAFPEIDAEAVRAGVAAGRARLKELGFAVDVCPLDYGRTAEAVYRAALSRKDYDIVVIGAGIRLDPALTPLFEVLVDTTHELAPGAKLCFNVSPSTTVEAVQRWWPERRPLV